ncbi:hypothetical protein DBR00_17845 [Pseudomonas sp. HMWF032]|nr:hypothetical protein DBR00_17845 [Pseudomonas sp. HMWF032]PTT78917.1 hypothetical protein DBR41_22445 [Pseudomonas sp. HMWF010]
MSSMDKVWPCLSATLKTSRIIRLRANAPITHAPSAGAERGHAATLREGQQTPAELATFTAVVAGDGH